MQNTLIVVAHGIGNATEDFCQSWESAIRQNTDLTNVTVKGLFWEEVLQKVEDKYDVVSGAMADVVAMCGFADLQTWVGNDSWKVFKDYMMDVLVYVGLPDMWLMIQDECALKLEALRRDANGKEVFKEADTILVGHSLGAAMLPHLVWREFAETGTVPYRGMILLASPLGFESPIRHVCKDFLQRMGEYFDWDRLTTLSMFARMWNMLGKDKLRFICNENDIVCSDVKFQVAPGKLVDLIPLRQAFTPAEIKVLNTEHPGCIEFISFGTRDPGKIAENHDILTYLKQPQFSSALSAMLGKGA